METFFIILATAWRLLFRVVVTLLSIAVFILVPIAIIVWAWNYIFGNE